MLVFLLTSLFIPQDTGSPLSPIQIAGTEYPCRIVTVKDGDTVIVEIDLYKFGDDDRLTMRTPVRLYGINTPEIHTTNAEEKAKGLESKAYLETLTKDKQGIRLVVKQKEKFGRLLGVLKDGEMVINQKMIDAGHAKAWDGLGVRPW